MTPLQAKAYIAVYSSLFVLHSSFEITVSMAVTLLDVFCILLHFTILCVDQLAECVQNQPCLIITSPVSHDSHNHTMNDAV